MNTVEKIHNEIDLCQTILLDGALKKINQDTKTIREISDDERVADRMSKFGFINTVTAKNAIKIKDSRIAKLSNIDINSKLAEKIKYYNTKYPDHKFLTEEQFDLICKKYKLIYAPTSAYIKDIPLENLRELENIKTIETSDISEDEFQVTKIDYDRDDSYEKLKNLLGIKNDIFRKSDVDRAYDLYISSGRLSYGPKNPTEWNFGESSDNMIFYNFKTLHKLKFTINEYHKIEKNGYFIAAPKSHFDLDKLKRSTFGYFSIKIFEPKDPIVFEYVNGGLLVSTKWGDEENINELD